MGRCQNAVRWSYDVVFLSNNKRSPSLVPLITVFVVGVEGLGIGATRANYSNS